VAEPSPGAPLVLLVDDDRDTREMYGVFLAASGFRVEQAATAQQALEHAAALLPDVVVTDLSLPGLDGTALAERLRCHPGLQHVPIVAVTGHAANTPGNPGLQSVFADVLVKPCMPDDLVKAIRGALASAPGLPGPRGGTPARPER